MDWFSKIISTIISVVKTVVSIISNVISGSTGGGGGWSGSGGGHEESHDAPTPAELEHERIRQEQIRHQQDIQRKTKAFDKDVSRSPDPAPQIASGFNQVVQGAIQASQRRPMHVHTPDISQTEVQKALLTPVNPYLYLWTEPEADRVRQILKHTPGIVNAALRIRSTPKEALNWLLAYGLNLSNEEITTLLEMHQAEKRKSQSPSIAEKQALIGQLADLNGGIIDSHWAQMNVDSLMRLLQHGRATGKDGHYQNSPCPPPKNGKIWFYDPKANTCTLYSDAEVKDTQGVGRVTMSVEQANEYVKQVGDVKTLFLKPSHLLNDRNLTNMSEDALAALTYAQVFQEENWFKEYNWIHPFYGRLDDPAQGGPTSYVNSKRGAKTLLSGIDEYIAFFREGDHAWRLRGFGYGLGNQPYNQAWDAANWYIDYAQLLAKPSQKDRYGTPNGNLPDLSDQALVNIIAYRSLAGQEGALMQTAHGFGVETVLKDELKDAQKSQYWNVMRFLWAGARQREGLYSDTRDERQQQGLAIDYSQLEGKPVKGRPAGDVSAFSLIGTVYSDQVVISNFINSGDPGELKKAINVIEMMGPNNKEGRYRIQQPLGINLRSEYDITMEDRRMGVKADFLPYNKEEATTLVNKLLSSNDTATLCKAPLLLQGYKYYNHQDVNIKCP